MDATAEAGNERPLGSRQHLLVFVRAGSKEAALTEGMMALTDKAWSNGELKQIEQFIVAPASIEDPVTREAALAAEQGNRSIIVFDQA
jgi:hypothetical protein